MTKILEEAWSKANERRQQLLEEELQRQYELDRKKSIAEANAITFCTSHGIPETAIEETANDYRFCIEFNYK